MFPLKQRQVGEFQGDLVVGKSFEIRGFVVGDHASIDTATLDCSTFAMIDCDIPREASTAEHAKNGKPLNSCQAGKNNIQECCPGRWCRQ